MTVYQCSAEQELSRDYTKQATRVETNFFIILLFFYESAHAYIEWMRTSSTTSREHRGLQRACRCY